MELAILYIFLIGMAFMLYSIGGARKTEFAFIFAVLCGVLMLFDFGGRIISAISDDPMMKLLLFISVVGAGTLIATTLLKNNGIDED